ncbi:TetR family transcriptional regulator [Streptomyces olivoreticuli]|nr:TetR family transcriptional regulator [Streptomyces olivoreticuli]WKK23617.1 TetR family transcriptional regulator [Streptomyces olivoreticuli]
MDEDFMAEGDENQALGLRERKKLRTRQRISDVATALFIERGFDNVPVAEVAKAAGVSTMTVFNYFPRKEDLFLDRIPEAVDLFTRAVRERHDGETPVGAVHRLLLGLLDQRHPLAAVADRFVFFGRIVLDSPALRARAREGVEEVENALATAVAETTGAPVGDQRPRLVAALTVAACRATFMAAAGRLLAGERAEDIVDSHRSYVDETFAALDRALYG